MSYDVTAFQVGDEFEDGPVMLGKVISAILAEGGSFDLDGNSLMITSLPNRKPITAVIPDPKPEPVVSVSPPAPKPVAVEPASAANIPEVPKVEPATSSKADDSESVSSAPAKVKTASRYGDTRKPRA